MFSTALRPEVARIVDVGWLALADGVEPARFAELATGAARDGLLTAEQAAALARGFGVELRETSRAAQNMPAA